MALPGRNDPCPCLSGKKFKKCCFNLPREEVESLEAKRQRAKDEAELAKTEALVETLRAKIAENQAQREVIKNFAEQIPLPDETVSKLRDLIDSTGLHVGTTDDFIIFIEPLMSTEKSSPDRLEFAVKIGLWFWKLVLQRDADTYEEGVKELQTKLQDFGPAAAALAFGYKDVRRVADAMKKRHKFLFPHIWRQIYQQEREART